jgi:hypothetical protein
VIEKTSLPAGAATEIVQLYPDCAARQPAAVAEIAAIVGAVLLGVPLTLSSANAIEPVLGETYEERFAVDVLAAGTLITNETVSGDDGAFVPAGVGVADGTNELDPPPPHAHSTSSAIRGRHRIVIGGSPP